MEYRCKEGLGKEFYACNFNSEHMFTEYKEFINHQEVCPNAIEMERKNPRLYDFTKNFKQERQKYCPFTRDHFIKMDSFDNHIASCPFKPINDPAKSRSKKRSAIHIRYFFEAIV